MAIKINRAAFEQSSFSNKDIKALTYIVHKLPKKGYYQGKVMVDEKIIDHFDLNYSDESKEHQTDIDLGVFASNSLSEKGITKFAVGGEGYVVFYNSTGTSGLRIRLDHLQKGKLQPTFDNTKLKKGDIMTVTLLRPGTYQALSANSKSALNIEVLYPSEKLLARREEVNKPMQVEVGKGGFNIKKLSLLPAQGISFRLLESSSVTIQLQKPVNGKFEDKFRFGKRKEKRKANRKARWVNQKIQ